VEALFTLPLGAVFNARGVAAGTVSVLPFEARPELFWGCCHFIVVVIGRSPKLQPRFGRGVRCRPDCGVTPSVRFGTEPQSNRGVSSHCGASASSGSYCSDPQVRAVLASCGGNPAVKLVSRSWSDPNGERDSVVENSWHFDQSKFVNRKKKNSLSKISNKNQ
jgi:hypothetical protein